MHVRWHLVIREVAPKHLLQPPTLFGKWGVHMGSERRLQFLQPCPHPIGTCAPLQLKATATGPDADEDKTQELEGLRFALPTPPPPPPPLCRIAAELQQTGLLPVQFEPESLEPLAHVLPEAPGIAFMLETGNEIVGVAHEDHLAPGFALPPLPGPEIEDTV